jgi:hypothetical protein|tara:strand:+ start:410 stop:1393 length:984 start_codon:yes stop_codon:yes gene_type:complete
MGLLKKIGRSVKKVVRKVVPKEIAGIMQVAAPFVAPYSLPAAAALTFGGQLRQGRGRISPLKTAFALLPGVQFQGGQGLGAFKPTGFTRFGDANFGSGISARQLLFGGPQATGKLGAFGDKAESFLFGSPEKFAQGNELDGLISVADETQGLLGMGGKFGPEGSLLSKTDGTLSYTKVGAAAASGLSLMQTQAQIEEEGEEVGLSSSEIARLQAEAAEMWEDFDTTQFKPNVAQGGLMRTNYALGSRPTEQESGLGGLPIEADMRYSGGFMPYGAKEKADDVPARLSKNEFVFTADAVRGAGGGDINTGAKKMYQSMKQLEQMGKRA